MELYFRIRDRGRFFFFFLAAFPPGYRVIHLPLDRRVSTVGVRSISDVLLFLQELHNRLTILLTACSQTNSSIWQPR